MRLVIITNDGNVFPVIDNLALYLEPHTDEEYETEDWLNSQDDVLPDVMAIYNQLKKKGYA